MEVVKNLKYGVAVWLAAQTPNIGEQFKPPHARAAHQLHAWQRNSLGASAAYELLAKPHHPPTTMDTGTPRLAVRRSVCWQSGRGLAKLARQGSRRRRRLCLSANPEAQSCLNPDAPWSAGSMDAANDDNGPVEGVEEDQVPVGQEDGKRQLLGKRRAPDEVCPRASRTRPAKFVEMVRSLRWYGCSGYGGRVVWTFPQLRLLPGLSQRRRPARSSRRRARSPSLRGCADCRGASTRRRCAHMLPRPTRLPLPDPCVVGALGHRACDQPCCRRRRPVGGGLAPRRPAAPSTRRSRLPRPPRSRPVRRRPTRPPLVPPPRAPTNHRCATSSARSA